MMKKKIVKRVFVLFFLLAILALVGAFFVNRTNVVNILLAGSTSLNPLMVRYSDIYLPNDKAISLIVASGGSGFGIKSVALGQQDIGLASKNPYSSIITATINKNGYDKTVWKEAYMKTFTIAFDSVAIVYKTPTNIKQLNLTSMQDFRQLFEIFAGYQQYHFSDFGLVTKGAKDDFAFHAHNVTGGARAAGVAASFLDEAPFDWEQQKEKYQHLQVVQNNISVGSYVHYPVVFTSESNLQSWNKIKTYPQNGAIAFFPLSFVLQNWSDFQQYGFNVARINNVNPSDNDFVENTKKFADYKWHLPFNLMVSLKQLQNNNLRSNTIKAFLKYLYTDKTALRIMRQEFKLFAVADAFDLMAPNDPNNKKFNTLFNLKYADNKIVQSDNIYGINWRSIKLSS